MKRLFSRLTLPLVAVAFWAVLSTTAPIANAGVLAFGSYSTGATGLGPVFHDTSVATPIVTTNLVGRTIVQIAAGQGHTLMVAKDGSVFSCGHNGFGQLGQGSFNESFRIATPIVTTDLVGRTIVQAAAGDSHSLLVADDGSVFSFGNNGHGQLGLGASGTSVTIATPIDGANLGSRKIIQSAAGRFHSLLLSDDGSVFSFGSNFSGQLGLGTTGGNAPIATPIDATNLGGRKITQVAAGDSHSLLLADDGSVFSFGSNSSLQLGRTPGSYFVATPIDATNLGGRKITQIAADGEHSLLLADDGSVFSFGNNFGGQLGLGTTGGYAAVATPIDTTNLDGLKITEVSAGHVHSLIKAEDGRAFSFGWNTDGQLGLVTIGGMVPVATPINTTNLGGQVISQLAAGDWFSLLLAEPALPGDFNQDGSVDAADYVMWRKLNNTPATLPNDPTFGTDDSDSGVWRSHFGESGSGSGGAADASEPAVPEPATVVLIMIGGSFVNRPWRRARAKNRTHN